MTSQSSLKTILIIAAVLAMIAYLSIFTVDERQRAIQFRMGEIVSTDFKPGLYFQVPLYNNVKTFDARVLSIDLPTEQFLTNEKKNVDVDSFVKWHIKDVSSYYRATLGDEKWAVSRLAQIISNAIKNQFSNRTIHEVIAGERREIMASVQRNVDIEAQKLGIEIVDVRIKRIEFPDDVTDSIYARMIAERQTVANTFRSEGHEEAKIIRAEAERLREELLSEAYREAETNRGEGDAIASETYAQAFGKDPEFYDFYRSLNAYKEIFSDGQDIMVIRPDSEFFKYFNDLTGPKVKR